MGSPTPLKRSDLTPCFTPQCEKRAWHALAITLVVTCLFVGITAAVRAGQPSGCLSGIGMGGAIGIISCSALILIIHAVKLYKQSKGVQLNLPE